jgi:hypothetical protein
LARGLVVEIGISEKFNLRISRVGKTMPSLQEWRTVINHLPDIYHLSAPTNPRYLHRDNRHFLDAAWPIQERLL